MKRFAILAGLALTCLSAAQTGKIRSITLERRPCYGTCPVYTLTLNADGTALYNGVRYAARTGKYKGTFWANDLTRLAPLLDRMGFWKLQSEYRTMATDQSTQVLTVVTDKGTKKVLEYGHQGPAELWALHTIVDGIGANAREWTKVAPPAKGRSSTSRAGR